METRIETDLQNGEAGGDDDSRREEIRKTIARDLGLAMDIIGDDLLQPDPHVDGGGDERKHQRGDDGLGEIGFHRAVIGADMADDRVDQENRERDVGERGEPLAPEGLGAAMRGAKPAHLFQGYWPC